MRKALPILALFSVLLATPLRAEPITLTLSNFNPWAKTTNVPTTASAVVASPLAVTLDTAPCHVTSDGTGYTWDGVPCRYDLVKLFDVAMVSVPADDSPVVSLHGEFTSSFDVSSSTGSSLTGIEVTSQFSFYHHGSDNELMISWGGAWLTFADGLVVVLNFEAGGAFCPTWPQYWSATGERYSNCSSWNQPFITDGSNRIFAPGMGYFELRTPPDSPAVPEPASLALLGTGLAGVWVRARRSGRS